MAESSRRSFLTALLTPTAAECVLNLENLAVESGDSPFFEHYHQLLLPVSALLAPPKDGVTVVTSAVDQGSYDTIAFEKFIKSSGLNADNLKVHRHEVQITAAELSRIAAGEKEVEVRVISKAGNYVHNFKITASASALARIRRGK